MRSVLVLLGVLGALLFQPAAEPVQAPKLKQIEGSDSPIVSHGFSFTISPDDQWLIFFKRDDSGEDATAHYLYGRLRLLNLRTGEMHAFTIPESEEGLTPFEYFDACWAEDSSLCVLPPAPIRSGVRILINLPKDGKPRTSIVREKKSEHLSGSFTCSDCVSRPGDLDLMQKHIPEEFQIRGDTSRKYEMQVVSVDGKKIYFQKGPQVLRTLEDETTHTTLFEIDVETGKQRELITHVGECAKISQLRPSPDGKSLAYQVTLGCTLSQIPEIYVLDLPTAKTQKIARGSGPMRWSKSSDKLLFYRKTIGEEDASGDCLWFAEFGTPDGPNDKAPN